MKRPLPAGAEGVMVGVLEYVREVQHALFTPGVLLVRILLVKFICHMHVNTTECKIMI